jgi:hypothetical protein
MMEKYQKVISAVILAAGLMVLGLCIKSGIDNFTNKDRRVTVKGLSERIVDADKATWTLTVEKSGDELNSLYASLNSDVATIQTFLEENGVEGKATVKTSTINVNDNLSNAWGEDKPRYHYTTSRSVYVTSPNTQFINKLRCNTDELLDMGVILESDYAEYEYTQFQQLKPEMMAEAIANAEKTASQFAENSHSTINKIVEAGQGEFSIDDADEPYKKKVRVVSTITYSLKD